ncbi:uncharacterized protein YhfF [Streptohalobacillus salinus]|uniref:Uncharacterized protein YhfF n=1 Tax=Streptohalobacillus salinus TaxID=621096 RepID=A0A2V3W0B9_9BACI|nr:ASCH domain-containing protein [Streptohalobacillus salinus]PXW87340.1 uncharacterized protein YhfF [Streptohalobacillus salinus]
MNKQSIVLLWNTFKAEHPGVDGDYQAWAFGDSEQMADQLAELVVKGIKTATASNQLLYQHEEEPLPEVGQYNIILDGKGMAVAIVETTSVEVVPFREVTAAHAFLEGEGDRSLAFWREVHEDFFRRELAEVGLAFNEDMPVVCERFVRVF